jgi:hypothetical protein
MLCCPDVVLASRALTGEGPSSAPGRRFTGFPGPARGSGAARGLRYGSGPWTTKGGYDRRDPCKLHSGHWYSRDRPTAHYFPTPRLQHLWWAWDGGLGSGAKLTTTTPASGLVAHGPPGVAACVLNPDLAPRRFEGERVAGMDSVVSGVGASRGSRRLPSCPCTTPSAVSSARALGDTLMERCA